ncbi:CRISPR-associated protein Cas2 [Methanocaldococcus infernus ME]|uniref:CRISPR-associated endoribonuclease Cas2 n=1 Tax=Methanocaldococcus infernus (strain DSM 11812 / JCM 15783 / ME) TaxID=573063 RepID=D5VSN6_METIM|nr:CRISPR-associated endonuclease Cas2 [Methanocaldococcus infernus]ADG13589.1 CRISPR-associated protein Cas2 [Methanocaldococcus infernus ME]
MYIIIVYDVNVKRVNKVKSFLRKHLNWIQNSVFEGEVTESELEWIKTKLSMIINKEEDAIVIYKLKSKPKREIIGIEKNPIDDII